MTYARTASRAAASGAVKAGGGSGFEIFSQLHFGLTEFAEKINYQRALEGELAAASAASKPSTVPAST